MADILTRTPIEPWPLPVKHQRNIWGSTEDPHRVDLWFVDFKHVRDGIIAAYTAASAQGALGGGGVMTAPPLILPQYIQSITLPEPHKVRAEPVRRESIPYPMPSWDEPLEPITMVLLLNSENPNPIIALLEQWNGLVRAGRGLRSGSGALFQSGENLGLILNNKFRIDFRFNITIYLLQGSTGTVEPPLILAESPAQSNVQRNAFQQFTDSLRTLTSGSRPPATLPFIRSQGPPASSTGDYSVLQAVKTWVARVWLSSYKVADLSYAASGLVTVTATFQTEYLQLELAP